MIEKFSDEELKQIMNELGLKTDGIRMESVIREEIFELEDIEHDKPQMRSQSPWGKLYESVLTITSLCLNNVLKTSGKRNYWKCSNVISAKDKDEFKQMFQEILEIIKKHNRKWEGGTD